MLDANQVLALKNKFSEPDRLVQAVNIGSHNEAIKQAHAVCIENAVAREENAGNPSEDLLQLLLSQVSEEVTVEDPFYEWITVSDWVRKHGQLNPADGGWLLEDDWLYRPRSGYRG